MAVSCVFAKSISALDAGFGTGKRCFSTEGVLPAFDFGIGSKINTGKKVTLCKICLEDHLYKEERLVVK